MEGVRLDGTYHEVRNVLTCDLEELSSLTFEEGNHRVSVEKPISLREQTHGGLPHAQDDEKCLHQGVRVTDREIETDMRTQHRETIIIAKRTEKITTFYPVASSNSHLGCAIANNRKHQPRADSMRFRWFPN